MADPIESIELAAKFACLVTMETNKEDDWVARNGKHSIYGVLEILFPRVGVHMFCLHNLQAAIPIPLTDTILHSLL